MKERPILFSAPMVRAILDGSKTQTRRIVKPQFASDAVPAEMCAETAEGWQTIGHSGMWWCDAAGCADDAIRCPYGIPGDRLWVRETFAEFIDYDLIDGRSVELGRDFVYRADGEDQKRHTAWRPSIHMPRAASRIDLEITGVRVERLQDISEADAVAEGVEPFINSDGDMIETATTMYERLWEQINGAGSWEANPWVWVVEFKRTK
jgi:hypothetical protein